MATTDITDDEFNSVVDSVTKSPQGYPLPGNYKTEKSMLGTIANNEIDDAFYSQFPPEPPVPPEVAEKARIADENYAKRKGANTPTASTATNVPTKNLVAQVQSPIMTQQGRTNALAELTSRPEIAAEFNEVVNGMKSQKDSAIAEIRKARMEEEEAQSGIERLQLTKGELASKRFKDAQIQDQRAAADKYGFVSRSGVNTEEADSLVNQVTTANVKLFKMLDPLGQQISELQSVSFLDDPVSFLAAQFQLPGLVGKYNAIAANINRGDDFIKSQDALVTATNNANAGKLASKSAEEVENLSQQELVDAQIKAKQAAVTAAKTRGASAKEEQAINDRYNASIFAITNHEIANEDRKSRYLSEEENRARDRFLRDEAMGIKLRDADAREKKRLDDEIQNRKIEAAARSVGMSGINNLKEYEKMPKEKKDILSTAIASDGTQIAKTPVELLQVWKYIQSASNSNDPEMQKEMESLYTRDQRKMVKEVAIKAQEFRVAAEKTGAKGQQLIDLVNEGVTNYFTGLKNRPEEKKDNNYYAPTPILPFANSPSMKGNLAAIATIETAGVAAKSGKEVTTAGMLNTLASQAVDAKSLPKSAEDVVAMYQAIVDNTNKTMRFSRMGLPDQNSYLVKVKGVEYDMLNPARVQRALLESYKDSQEFGRRWFGKNPAWKAEFDESPVGEFMIKGPFHGQE